MSSRGRMVVIEEPVDAQYKIIACPCCQEKKDVFSDWSQEAIINGIMKRSAYRILFEEITKRRNERVHMRNEKNIGSIYSTPRT